MKSHEKGPFTKHRIEAGGIHGRHYLIASESYRVPEGDAILGVNTFLSSKGSPIIPLPVRRPAYGPGCPL